MVGTVYLSSEPGSPPFVSEGATVSAGDTLLIVEANQEQGISWDLLAFTAGFLVLFGAAHAALLLRLLLLRHGMLNL